MDRLVELARSCVPDKFVIARVRARGDDPTKHLVQVSGRRFDFVARGYDRHVPGEDVLVILEPHVLCPHIVSTSPWRSNLTVVNATKPNGDPWTAADVDGLDAAISASGDVAANLAAAHNRSHGFQDVLDHTDVSATGATNEQVLAYSSSTWSPFTLTVTLDGGTR